MRKIFLVMLISLMLCSCSSQQKSPPSPPVITKSIVQPSSEVCPIGSTGIASWNIENLGQSKSDEELAYIAEAFQDFDIVAVQEVVSGKGGSKAVAQLEKILDSLGTDWSYSISEATQGTTTEKFAFFWKSENFSLHKASTGLLIPLQSGMVRPPYKGVFVNGQGEFHLHSFHLAPTSKNPRMELEYVGENTDLFETEKLIFMGDMNLSKKEISPVMEKVLGLTCHISGKTSLKRDYNDGNYLSKEYDNICTSPDITVVKSGIVDFIPEFDDFTQAKGISDHLPVFVCLE